ncbi:hypothetical protein CPC08DRAFT_702855 [Agrocybe pediades]|nr:hypothetical protein CPC08DRAFT_702855 [Agrocybe pediades]
MPIATAPALLVGLGARILLDYYNRSDGPFVKDFILAGVWQGVALHYAARGFKSSTIAILIALAIATKLFIEFNFGSDLTRCVATVLGVALGVLFTDFLSQYFDKPRHSSSRRHRKTASSKTPRKHERVVQFRPSVQGGSVETVADMTEVTDLNTFATTSHFISDITSVDSNSDKMGPTSSMSALEREVHLLRTRAALADSERRRLKEERKWAISQGNIARASQMKWEVKRYTSLMETFNREADMKAQEAAAAASNDNGNGSGYRQTEADEPKSGSSSSRSKPARPLRDTPIQSKAHSSPANGRPLTSTKAGTRRPGTNG